VKFLAEDTKGINLFTISVEVVKIRGSLEAAVTSIFLFTDRHKAVGFPMTWTLSASPCAKYIMVCKGNCS